VALPKLDFSASLTLVSRKFPQRLKPFKYSLLYGTAEAVPLQIYLER